MPQDDELAALLAAHKRRAQTAETTAEALAPPRVPESLTGGAGARIEALPPYYQKHKIPGLSAAFPEGFSQQDVYESLPPALAAALSFAAGPAGVLPALAGAFLGGAGGEGLRQTGARPLGGPAPTTPEEASKRMMGEGAYQTALDALGIPVGVGLRGLSRAVLPEPPATLLQEVGEDLGLPARPHGRFGKALTESTFLGGQVGEAYGEKGVARAAAEAAEQAKTLGVPLPPPEPTTAGLKASIKDTLAAEKLATKEAEATRKAEFEANRQANLDAIKERMTALERQQASALKTFRKEQADELRALRAQHQDLTRGLTRQKAGTIAATRAALTDAQQRALQAEQHFIGVAAADLETGLLKLGPDRDPIVLGDLLKGAVKSGRAVGYEEAQRLYGEADKAIGNRVNVDIAAWKKEFATALQENAPLQNHPALLKLRKAVFGTPTAEGAAEGGLPDVVPWQTARQIQKQLGGVLPVEKALLHTQKEGPLYMLWRDLTQAAEGAVAISAPDALPVVKVANNYYKEFANTFDRREVVSRLVKADPEYFVDKIPADGITAAKRLRRAIAGYAEAYGSAEEKELASEAMDALQRATVKDRLLNNGIEGLPASLKAFHPGVLEEVFSTSKGAEVLANTRRIAGAVEKVKPALQAQLLAERKRLAAQLGEASLQLTAAQDAALQRFRASAAGVRARQPPEIPEGIRMQFESGVKTLREAELPTLPKDLNKEYARLRLRQIEEALANSAAAVPAKAWFPVSMGLGGFGLVARGITGGATAGAAAEFLGGATAWALYNRVRAEQYAKALEAFGAGSTKALAHFFDAYRRSEDKPKRKQGEWSFLTPPPEFAGPPEPPAGLR